MKLKSMKKVEKETNVYEMVFTGELDGQKVEATAHRVDMNNCNLDYKGFINGNESASVRLNLLAGKDGEVVTFKLDEPLTTTKAINKMKDGAVCRSLVSCRRIGYGRCWIEYFDHLKRSFLNNPDSTLENLEAILTCTSLYQVTDQVESIWGVSYHKYTALTNAEILGEWEVLED